MAFWNKKNKLTKFESDEIEWLDYLDRLRCRKIAASTDFTELVANIARAIRPLVHTAVDEHLEPPQVNCGVISTEPYSNFDIQWRDEDGNTLSIEIFNHGFVDDEKGNGGS